MANLKNKEKQRLEKALNMGGGYVLGFSDRTFSEFFEDLEINIYDTSTYPVEGSGSKAYRMRSFWRHADDTTVGKVLMELFDNWQDYGEGLSPPSQECIAIAKRLLKGEPLASIIIPDTEDKVVATLRDSINQAMAGGQPEAALDRLHSLFVRYFRILCEKRSIAIGKDPLHNIFGKYVKHLRENKRLDSEMTERILRMSISILDAFNSVRNNQSYAHPNPPINRRESIFIVRAADNLLRFVADLEKDGQEQQNDELPF